MDSSRSTTSAAPPVAPGQRPRLSIVVPYRDRAEHLVRFLPHITAYFQRDKQADCDYVCFHDVDYLPIWADHSMPDRPTRIVWYGADRVALDAGSSKHVKHRYQSFFGAVVMIPKADFRRANGCGNEYWGRGYQDTDLRERCRAEGLEIGLRDGTFTVLPHQNRGFLPSGDPTEENRRNEKLYIGRRAVATSLRLHRQDGISNTEYKILARGPILGGPDRTPFPYSERVLVEF